MAKVGQIITGIAGYIENEFIKSLPAKSPAKVIVGTAVALYLYGNQEKIRAALESETAAAFGLVAHNGEYDLNLLKNTAMRYMDDEGMDVEFSTFIPNIKTLPVIGNMINDGIFPEKITLYKQDIEKILMYIEG